MQPTDEEVLEILAEGVRYTDRSSRIIDSKIDQYNTSIESTGRDQSSRRRSKSPMKGKKSAAIGISSTVRKSRDLSNKQRNLICDKWGQYE